MATIACWVAVPSPAYLHHATAGEVSGPLDVLEQRVDERVVRGGVLTWTGLGCGR